MKFNYTKSEYEELKDACKFQKCNQESEIFDLLCDGYSILQIECITNLSRATVNRRVKSIKDKISRYHDTFMRPKH